MTTSDWIQLAIAVVTLAAVAVAFWSAVGERRARKVADARAEAAEAARDLERKTADAERAAVEARTADRERRAQAELVLAWASFEGLGGNANYVMNWHVRIGNFSHAPVFDVVAVPLDGLQAQPVGAEAKFAVLAPGALEDRALAHQANREQVPSVNLYFRDLAGRRWKRYSSGVLEENNDNH